MRSAVEVAHPASGYSRTDSAGLTLVETLVAIFVAALFLIMLYTLNSVVGVGTAKAREMAVAAAYADHYLQWQTTDKTDQRTALTAICASTPNLVDLTANPNAAGQVIANVTTADPDFPLPSPVSTTWRGFFPAGCSATAPMLWTLKIIWGPSNQTVQQAIYVR